MRPFKSKKHLKQKDPVAGDVYRHKFAALMPAKVLKLVERAVVYQAIYSYW